MASTPRGSGGPRAFGAREWRLARSPERIGLNGLAPSALRASGRGLAPSALVNGGSRRSPERIGLNGLAPSALRDGLGASRLGKGASRLRRS
jgi:hypothetical protein